jgi:Flp pilus assembly pilin Flp
MSSPREPPLMTHDLTSPSCIPTRTSAKASVPSLRDDERGLSTVEYIIILVLIAVIAITAWKQFGEAVEFHVRDSTTQVNNLGL